MLSGRVNACYSTHVVLVVFSLFNVIIREQFLVHAGYEYRGVDGWVHVSREDINVGMEMEFFVDKVYACAGSLSIEGRV